LDRKEIEKEPSAKFLGLPSLVVYNMGGLCGWCTFDWLSTLLRMVLHGLHTLTRDWSLAIMLLVLCVRTVLHPLTRWSQVKMGLMGRRMQAVAPKQKAIQEKFKDDPRKIQEETAKLWREEGVNPLGCIGILPSFLQTPVWIAMYAALFFSFELRHQPGFYGIFQSIFGQPSATSKFWFLSDLAQPDRLIYFGRNLTQDISWLPNFDAINILPLLMGAVFFAQQKYLTPPTTATLTPEQEAQQKMIKWMSVLMFPLMMYNAPSGLALYFTTNSTLAIFESRWIRGHLDAYEKKNPPKKGGAPNSFMAKLMAAAAEKQKQSQSFQGGADRPPRKRV
jgi:YidC/Oxa1 family membrane protein insertase